MQLQITALLFSLSCCQVQFLTTGLTVWLVIYGSGVDKFIQLSHQANESSDVLPSLMLCLYACLEVQLTTLAPKRNSKCKCNSQI